MTRFFRFALPLTLLAAAIAAFQFITIRRG